MNNASVIFMADMGGIITLFHASLITQSFFTSWQFHFIDCVARDRVIGSLLDTELCNIVSKVDHWLERLIMHVVGTSSRGLDFTVTLSIKHEIECPWNIYGYQ